MLSRVVVPYFGSSKILRIPSFDLAMDLNTALALDVVQKREELGTVKKLKRSLGQTRRKNTDLSKMCQKTRKNFDFVAAKAHEILDKSEDLERENIALKEQLAEARDAEEAAEKKVTKLMEQIREARDAEEAAERVVTRLKLELLRKTGDYFTEGQ